MFTRGWLGLGEMEQWNDPALARRMQAHMPHLERVLPGQAHLITRALSGCETDVAVLVDAIWGAKPREWRAAKRVQLWDYITKLHSVMYMKVSRQIEEEKWELKPAYVGCVRLDCPESYNGREGFYCCLTCLRGEACKQDFHRATEENTCKK